MYVEYGITLCIHTRIVTIQTHPNQHIIYCTSFVKPNIITEGLTHIFTSLLPHSPIIDSRKYRSRNVTFGTRRDAQQNKILLVGMRWWIHPRRRHSLHNLNLPPNNAYFSSDFAEPIKQTTRLSVFKLNTV